MINFYFKKYTQGVCIYKSTKNQKYYYKCGTIGCACNMRSEHLHDKFKALLDEYIVKIDEEKLPILKQVMLEIFERNNANNLDSKSAFQSQLKEVNKKLEHLEERFVNEAMSQEIFEKFHKKLKLEKDEIKFKNSHIVICLVGVRVGVAE